MIASVKRERPTRPRTIAAPEPCFDTIDYIDHRDFRSLAAERKLLDQEDDSFAEYERVAGARGLDTDLLPPRVETELFRRMNFLKCLAKRRLKHSQTPAHRLTRAEARGFLKRATKIRDHLVAANMRLVLSVASRLVRDRDELDELIAEGYLTLLRAVERFDCSRGFRFSTYAVWSLKHNLNYLKRRAARIATQVIAVSPHVSEYVGEANPLHGPDEAQAKTIQEHLGALLSDLDSRSREVLEARFGLGAHERPLSLSKLGRRLGISKERVRQLEQRALSKLREHTLDETLEAALNGRG